MEHKASGWLTPAPSPLHHADLNPLMFRMFFPIRYGRTPQDLRALRDGCCTVFFVVHAMKCERGRLTIRSHTDFRDIIGNMCAVTWGLTAVRIEVSSTREFNLVGVNRVLTLTC